MPIHASLKYSLRCHTGGSSVFDSFIILISTEESKLSMRMGGIWLKELEGFEVTVSTRINF